jgi:hypothetical protein
VYPVLGRRNAPREREPPTPSDWETCSGWGNRGRGSGSGIQYLVGSETRGRLDLSESLDADRPEFLLFSQVQNHAHINIESSQQQDSSPPHQQKHRDRLVRKEGETDAVKATPPAANSTPRCGYLAQALICVRNRHPMQRRNRRFAMHGDQCKGETSISQARLADSDAMAPG